MNGFQTLKHTVKELWKKEKWYWCAAVVLGVAFSIAFSAQWTKGYSQMIQGGISAKVVRFHVLANSDSTEDQALKLRVRDKILADFAAVLTSCESKAETLAALETVQGEICQRALEEVISAGYDYSVSVSIVREEFPFKRYEDLIFPAGVYDALRIEIGAAAGQNWWCVLYPQMCFVDASWGYGTEESYMKLENTLTEEEFLVISAMTQEAVTPKMKLKVVEWWQERT